MWASHAAGLKEMSWDWEGRENVTDWSGDKSVVTILGGNDWIILLNTVSKVVNMG